MFRLRAQETGEACRYCNPHHEVVRTVGNDFVAPVTGELVGLGRPDLLTPRRRLDNQIALDHCQAMISAVPLLVLEAYEPAYYTEFGANAAAYIGTFIRLIDGRSSPISYEGLPPNGASREGDQVAGMILNALSGNTVLDMLDARCR